MQTAAGSHFQAHDAASTSISDGSIVASAVLLLGFCRSVTELAVLGSAVMCAETGTSCLPEDRGASGMTAKINRMLADRQWVEDARRWAADPSHQRAAQAFLDACRDAVPMEVHAGCLADPQWLMVFQSAFEVHPTLGQDADTFLRAVGLAPAPAATKPKAAPIPEAPAKPAPVAPKPAPVAKTVDRGPWDIAFALTLIGGALRAPGWWQLGALLGDMAANEQRRRELDAIPAWRDLSSRLLASRALRKVAKVFMFQCLAAVPPPGGSLTVALQTPAWWGMLSQALAANPQLMAIAQEVLRLAATPGSPSPAPAAPEALPVPAYEFPAAGLELAGRGWATASIPECESARTPSLVPVLVLPSPFHRIRRRWATLPRSRFVAMWRRLDSRRKQAMWMLAVQVQVLASRLGAAPEHRGVVRGSDRAHEDRTGAVLAPLVEMTSRDHGADTWTRRRVPRLNSGFWRRLHAARGRARNRGSGRG